jgi:hypothetical protein
MKFQKGQSGNPGGRKRSLGLSRAVRKNEGLKTWKMLLDVRDERIREEKVEMRGGEPVVVDVVPSVKERREAFKLILAYCWGTPVQIGQDELEARITELEQAVANKERR